MDVQCMTLDGRVDKDAFVEEWWNSESKLATFVQTKETVFLMPTGVYKSLTLEQELEAEKVKFAGTYIRHTFVVRDFEISDEILGGGYLTLS